MRRSQVFTSDLRVRVKSSGLATYPDLTVVCGELELDPDDAKGHTVTNPKVIVEVVSPSNEKYDRGEKFEHYRTIAALEEVVLVVHDRREIEIRRREPDGTWSTRLAGEGEVARLASIGSPSSTGYQTAHTFDGSSGRRGRGGGGRTVRCLPSSPNLRGSAISPIGRS